MATLFSKIIRGDIPSFKLYEDEWTFAFLTLDAIQLGHSLVVPKIEVDLFSDVPEPYYSAIFKAAKPLAKAIHKATACKRVGSIFAGWDVPHCHYHLVPMFDGGDLDFRRGRQRTKDENIEMQNRILAALAGT